MSLPPLDVAEHAARPSHSYLVSDGARLRITRWAPGVRRRDVYRVLDDGGLVELGHVVSLGAPTFMAYPALELAPGWGCDSYIAGARLLSARLEITTLQVHTIALRNRTED